MMDENSAGCASEAAVDAIARGALERIIGMCDVPEACPGCGRPQGLGAIVQCAKTALATLPAPTISQDVPAPAAVTAEMAADIAAAREWVEAQPDDDENYHQDYFDGLAVTKRALASLAALSAATPLQSDLAADNARLREAKAVAVNAYGDRHAGSIMGPLGGHYSSFAAGWDAARAALQGADNHE